MGEDITSVDSPWVKQGVTPLAALLSWQGESGAFQADFGEGRFDDFFSTVQSMPAVSSVEELAEEVIAPPNDAESQSDPEPTAEPEVSVEVDEESEETVIEEEQDDADESEDSGGGLPNCSAALAIPLLVGFAFVLPSRRRR